MAGLNERYQQANAMFDAFDRNGNGYLTPDEFRQAMEQMRAPAAQSRMLPSPQFNMPNPQVEALFDAMDRDKDGKLGPAEFDDLLRTLGKPPSESAPALQPLPMAAPAWVPPVKYVDVGIETYNCDKVITQLLLWIGMFSLFLLTLVPMWIASFLLNDSTYVFFASKEAIWFEVLLGMVLAVFILVFTLTDARNAFKMIPCFKCFFSVPQIGVPDLDMPQVGLPGLPGLANLPYACLPNSICGVRVKVEAVIVTMVAIFLIILWSLLPSVSASLFAIPGFGPVLRLLTAPFRTFFGPFFSGIGQLFSASFSFLSWSAIVQGSNAASGVVLACHATYVFYGLTLWAFFNRSTQHPSSSLRSAQSLACVWATYMCILGFLFLAFAGSITDDALVTYNDLFTNCDKGAKTAEVFIAAHKLQGIRRTPVCAPFASVEECAGFEDTKHSQYLKDLENDRECRGFCYTASAVPAPPPELITAGGSIVGNATAAILYSNNNYRGSCEGAAARSMEGVVAGAGTQITYAGILFIIVSMCLIVLRSVDKCLQISDEDEVADANDAPVPAVNAQRSGDYGSDYGSIHSAGGAAAPLPLAYGSQPAGHGAGY